MNDHHANISRLLDRVSHAIDLIDDRPFGDGGTSMLFPRLRRSATNQIDAGPETISRYGIWAMTGRDHLAEALDQLNGGDVDEARRLIVQVANSLTAFAAVQKELDEGPLAGL